VDINESTFTYVYVTLALFSDFSQGKAGSRDERWHGSPDETCEGRLLRSRTRRNGYAKGSVTNEPCSQVLYSVGPPVPF